MTQHTPGPWTLEEDHGQRYKVRFAPHACYAFSINDLGNARLIAAAPDMLEALRELLCDKYLSDPINAVRMAKARAAIAKATTDQ